MESPASWNNKPHLLFIRKLVYQVLILNTKQNGRMDTGEFILRFHSSFFVPKIILGAIKMKKIDEKLAAEISLKTGRL